MEGTPEGRYFAANVVLSHASQEHRNAIRQSEQEEGLHASELWFQGFVFSEIAKQAANLCSLLEDEVPPHEYYIQTTQKGSVVSQTGVSNFGDAISEYNKEPIKDNSMLYVSLHVTEEYMRERTATVDGITTLRKEVRQATKHESPHYTFEPKLLQHGIIFLREKVESVMTAEERERAQRALK